MISMLDAVQDIANVQDNSSVHFVRDRNCPNPNHLFYVVIRHINQM